MAVCLKGEREQAERTLSSAGPKFRLDAIEFVECVADDLGSRQPGALSGGRLVHRRAQFFADAHIY